MKPPVYFIAIKDHKVSQKYIAHCRPTWDNAGLETHIHDACTPANIDETYCGKKLYFGLRSRRKRYGEPLTPTEKAIWYSHLALWMKCVELDRPIIIAEHDAFLSHPFPDDYFDNIKPIRILCSARGENACAEYCMCKDCVATRKKRDRTAGGAYYIEPSIAQNLIDEIDNLEILTYNSDSLIHDQMNKHGDWDHTRAYQYTCSTWGVTIDHGDNFTGALNKEFILERVINNANL